MKTPRTDSTLNRREMGSFLLFELVRTGRVDCVFFHSVSQKCGILESPESFPWPTVEGRAWQLGVFTEQSKDSLRVNTRAVLFSLLELVVGPERLDLESSSWPQCPGELSWCRKGVLTCQSSASATSGDSTPRPHLCPHLWVPLFY